MGILLWEKHWSGLAAAAELCNGQQALGSGATVSPRGARVKDRVPSAPWNLRTCRQLVLSLVAQSVCR